MSIEAYKVCNKIPGAGSRKFGSLYAMRPDQKYNVWKVAEVVFEDGKWITWPGTYPSREAAEEAARLGDEFGYIASAMRKGVQKP